MSEAEKYLIEHTEYEFQDYDVIHFSDMAKLMEDYHLSRLDSVTEGDIEKHFKGEISTWTKPIHNRLSSI